ncbi:hypothetical protein KR074_005125 [Drosophila pseudoananassae]|nr:hypothetical protein KR074_005125 [Drosophila pseudoananassae]
MFDWVGWLVKANSVVSHIIGLSNFECDWKSQLVFKSQRRTIYAILANILTVLLMAYFLSGKMKINVLFGNANKIHVYAITVMIGLRTAAGLSTLVNRWRQRRQMMHLARMVMRVYVARPQVKRMIRWAVLTKALTAYITDFVQLFIIVEVLERIDSFQLLGMSLQLVMSLILNISLSQHYMLMLIIWANYHLINTELQQVVEECQALSCLSPENATFNTRYSSLASQLDNIGIRQDRLQSIVLKLGQIFGIEGLIVYVGYYIGSVIIIYLSYSIVKNGPENLQMTLNAAFLTFAWAFFFYLDAAVTLCVMLNIQDDHQEMMHLLQKRALLSSFLDVRLNEAFEKLQLQVVRNPFQIAVMNILPINRNSTSAMLGSVIMNSIYLIQYDIENF